MPNKLYKKVVSYQIKIIVHILPYTGAGPRGRLVQAVNL